MFSTIVFLLNFGVCSGLIEKGFQDYNIILKKPADQKVVNLTKSMYKGSSITYTMNCVPNETKKSVKFDLVVALYHNFCHVPRNTVPLYEKKFVKLPCKKNLIANLTEVLKRKINTANTTSNTQVDFHPAKGIVGRNSLKTSKTGLYVLTLSFASRQEMIIEGRIESKHRGSYLSAMTYPLLPFYGVMSLLYLAYAIGWLIASCCNWKDLLRIQFWVGGVIALGMFENALFYSEYQSMSHSGEANGLLYFAEIISCAKRALARILVVIVSIGFGIVKPRLGQTLQKVLLVGGTYFVLASVEGCLRVRDEKELLTKKQMFALIPLTVLDVSICWWIFTSLVQTTRTLRIRKNVVKLTLYRHFTNTLIFTVLASLAYMIYMVKENKFNNCITITTFWLNEALWPFLFVVILAVIMILWRPSNNNQRYAFTPLDLDDDDGDDETTLSEAFEGMKMRTKHETTAKNRKASDDDLRWVEENIPSVPSTLLPTIDSDEEILTTKFEQSKMN